MKLENAKEILETKLSRSKICMSGFYPHAVIDAMDLEAISTVLQEIEHLQKENEELNTFLKRIEDKDLDEANIRAEAMLDMDKIWRNKIKEKKKKINIEGKIKLKKLGGTDRYLTKLEYMHKENVLQELLDEE